MLKKKKKKIITVSTNSSLVLWLYTYPLLCSLLTVSKQQRSSVTVNLWTFCVLCSQSMRTVGQLYDWRYSLLCSLINSQQEQHYSSVALWLWTYPLLLQWEQQDSSVLNKESHEASNRRALPRTPVQNCKLKKTNEPFRYDPAHTAELRINKQRRSIGSTDAKLIETRIVHGTCRQACN